MFWDEFDIIKPWLAHRAENFQKIFEYLDTFKRPVHIIETGCTRMKDNWEGDGQSTRLFDRYTLTDGYVESVDIDPKAVTLCKKLVSKHVQVHTGDSLEFLYSRKKLYDLVYLDSTDDPVHILKEFLAIQRGINQDTLMVVDDNFMKLTQEGEYLHWGKGMHLLQYANAIGKKPYFTGHQIGWVGL